VIEVNMNCPICAWSPEDPEYRFIFETTFWRVVLPPNQSLIGRCVVHLKRHTGDLADLSTDELLEWLTVVQALEDALRSAFGAVMFNWSCYMNHAYREEHPNPHIHWWAVPRYNQPFTIDDLTFEDPHFGDPYDHYRCLNVTKEMHQKIAKIIQRSLTKNSDTNHSKVPGTIK
jgi:diadenosine tetraphosphate (Ap4A) HIT family hydrolase